LHVHTPVCCSQLLKAFLRPQSTFVYLRSLRLIVHASS
jgi:hypothetical protein